MMLCSVIGGYQHSEGTCYHQLQNWWCGYGILAGSRKVVNQICGRVRGSIALSATTEKSGKTKHKNGFFFKGRNVLSQWRQNLPPQCLTTRLHHVATQSTQKLEYLCYMITHLPNLQLADCYWCLTMRNFETSRQNVLHSYIQQIFHHVRIMHSH